MKLTIELDDRDAERILRKALVEKVSPKKIEYDFESIYAKYPRKMGKKQGISKLKKIINSDKRYNNFVKAVQHYAEYCKDQDPQYIKHFSTFVNCYEDWINAPKDDSTEEQLKRMGR